MNSNSELIILTMNAILLRIKAILCELICIIIIYAVGKIKMIDDASIVGLN